MESSLKGRTEAGAGDSAGYKIAVIGLWHCGEIYSSCLAELGHEVVGISEERSVVDNFLKNIPPLPEPGLEDLLAKHVGTGHLSYTVDFSAVKNCNVAWFTFDTPVDDNDVADTDPIDAALAKAMPYFQNDILIVMTSQVPVGTAVRINALIKEQRPDLRFDYVYTPENLRLGDAIRCFMEPGRIICGVSAEKALKKINDVFAPLRTTLIPMSWASAEMAKHALNAFLATSLGFINDIADLCEKVGADILDVAKALRSDPRIGPGAYFDAGIGFSGGTLGRDLKALQSVSRAVGVPVPVIDGVFFENNARKNIVVQHLEASLGDLKNKKIAVFGLVYKPGTKTLRRSRSLEIARDLSAKGATLGLYDPAVDEKELPVIKNAAFTGDPYDAAASAQAIVFMTPWPAFKNLDFKKLSERAPGAVLLDTANLVYDKEEIIKGYGFNYRGIGR